MPKIYAPLPIFSLHADVTYLHPLQPAAVVHWEDPALQAMVDFKYLKAETIGPDEPIDNALIAVRNCTYHVLLVTSSTHKVLGLVSAEDLLGEKPLKAAEHKRLYRKEISVHMVMIPQQEIVALDIENLRHAKVAHIVHTLNNQKQHYALVVKIDPITHTQVVRGLFSLALISKQLGKDVTSDLAEAQSIAELQHHLHD
jgi:hypothetical protein